MAGLIGWRRNLQYTITDIIPLEIALSSSMSPSTCHDAEAVLEWDVDTPFSSQDKPPLAIPMVVTVNGVRSLKKFRLVIAQKSKLRLTQEVTAALASQSRDHRLAASSFFPCSMIGNTFTAMPAMDIVLRFGCVLPTMAPPFWCIGLEEARCIFIKPPNRRILLIPGIHYFDAHRLQPLLLQAPALQVHMRESSLVGLEGAGEQVDDPSSDEEQATTASETEEESEDDDEAAP